MKLSQGKDGIPLVHSTAQRDALFPTPGIDQRVQNLETGLIERYDGAAWVGVNTQGGAVFDAVRDFGTPSNGVDDATSAINAALTAMTSGGTLQFPRGTYKVTGQLTVANDGTALEFTRGASIAAAVASAEAALIFASDKDRVSVSGLDVGGSMPWAILVSGGFGHRLSGNRIRGGTVAAGGKCGGIFVQDASDVDITNNDIAECGDATLDAGADILINNGATIVSDLTIANNRCRSTDVVENICAFNVKDASIRDNKCSGARVFASSAATGGYGILCYQTDGIDPADVGDVLIEGNEVSDTNGIGIYAQDGMSRVTISDNTVLRPCQAQTEGSLLVAGIVCNGEDGHVVDNRIYQSGKNGIAFSTHEGITIADNQVVSPAADGIVVGPNATDTVIEDNVIRGIGVSCVAIGHRSFGNQTNDGIVIRDNTMLDVTHAIFLGSNAVNCTARDNHATGLTDTAYIALLEGAGAIIERNTGNGIPFPEGISDDRGDADRTLVTGVDFEVQMFNTVLTADRVVTLSETNVRHGKGFRIFKRGTAHTLTVKNASAVTIATIAAGSAGWVDVVRNNSPTLGNIWVATAQGTLS